jgi:hypothetical protein
MNYLHFCIESPQVRCAEFLVLTCIESFVLNVFKSVVLSYRVVLLNRSKSVVLVLPLHGYDRLHGSNVRKFAVARIRNYLNQYISNT